MESNESREIRMLLNEVLLRNGEGDKLKEKLTQLLVECGWKEEVNLMCRKVIQERGVDNVTPDDIVKEVTPAARAKVPPEVKQVLLDKIRNALLKEIDDRENGQE